MQIAATWRSWSRQRLFKGVRAASDPLTLRYRRIYIIPTRNGLMFALVLFVLWLAAINYSNSMLFVLAFLLAGFSVVAILHTFRNIAGLSLRLLPAEPTFAGDLARFPLQLDNSARRGRQAIGLQFGREAQGSADLAPARSGRLILQVPAPRRGWVSADRCAVFTIFPTGLFRAWSWVDLDARCLVYPRPEAGPVPSPPGARSRDSGPGRDPGDEDFRGLRRYRPGDSPRHVAWRTVARGQEPQTKEFAGQAPSRLWLDWDSLAGLDTEARLARLCRWVVDAEAAGRRYGLRLPGLEIPPGSGRPHRHRCLEALALYGS